METNSLKTLALKVLQRNLKGNCKETEEKDDGNLRETLFERGEAPSITTKIQHEVLCPEGPGACGFSMWRFSTATRELEWFCKSNATWCWQSEIATSLEKNG